MSLRGSDAVARHEAELAASIGTPHAVALAFARQAIAALLEAAGLGAGDAVALSPLTCKVVPLALLSLDLRPVWVDVSRATLNADEGELERAAAGAALRAVLFQHTYGRSAGLAGAERVCRERGLFLLEDCAQCLPLRSAAPSAAEALPHRAAVFSNNAMKPMPAGSGGVAVTSDDALAEGVRRVRDRLRAPTAAERLALAVERRLHAWLLWPWSYWPLFALAQRTGTHYEHRSAAEEVAREVRSRPGRIAPSQARAGSRALARVGELARHRSRLAADYARALEGTGVEVPGEVGDAPLCYFPVLVPAKGELLARARRARIEVVPWPLRTTIYPVEDERELEGYGLVPGACPVAERVARELVGLPLHARIGPHHRDAVVRLLTEHVAGR